MLTSSQVKPLDDFLGQGFAVLGLDKDPRGDMSRNQREAWELLGARFITVQRSSASNVEGEDFLVDHTGSLRAWLSRYRSRVVVLRPDRFVAAADRTGLDVPPARGNLDAHTPTHA